MKKNEYHIHYDKLFVARFPGEWAIFDLENYQSYVLNSTASLVFKLAEKGQDIEAISSYMAKRFGVARPTIKNELKKLYADFKRAGIMI